MSQRVAYQGEPGAYSDLAAREALGREIETVPCESFDAVFERLAAGEVERAVVPVENSLAGTIHRVYDLLLRHDLSIVGERTLAISHCLIAAPGVHLADIRVVRSHPHALAQCEHRLRELGLAVEVAADTAGAVKALAASGRRDAAALASAWAAEVYGLDVLQTAMEDHVHNYTRFIVLARDATAEPLEALDGADDADAPTELKVSVAFSLDANVPGALFRALAVFALRDLDLTKIESRPLPGEESWAYMFHLDFVTDDFAARGARALEHLGEVAPVVELLGVYPRDDRPH